MEFSEEIFSYDEEDNFQPTLLETNAESIKEIPIKADFKKWINSESEISTISNLIKLEINSSFDKNSIIIENNQETTDTKPNDQKQNDKIKYDRKKQEEIKEEKKKEEKDNTKHYFTFFWSGGGQKVKLTGEFCDWKIKYDMVKDPNNNKYKYEIPLDNKIYQFKFIVDNEWKYSPNYPTIKDNMGNINNVIDLTNYFKKDNNNNNNNNTNTKENSSTKRSEKEEKAQIMTSKKDQIQIIKKETSIYDCEYPSDDNIPLPLPNKRYYQTFKLDNYTHQNNLGKEEFFKYVERPSFSYETSSKPIFLLGHVNLNHLISFKNKELITAKNCMSFRYRQKACTILYYK